MTELTAQVIFDTSCRAILRQGKAAVENGKCKYRASDGSVCAVGALIPDEVYDPRVEGCGVSTITSWVPELVPHYHLLCRLQEAHDSTLRDRGIPGWTHHVAGIAREFNLSIEVLNHV
jgi:hypothetical protein